jgi:hypothetical protein
MGDPWISVFKNKDYWNALIIKSKKQGVRRMLKRKTSCALSRCFIGKWQESPAAATAGAVPSVQTPAPRGSRST